MASDPQKRTRATESAAQGDSPYKWLLGALGLLWVGGLALRALRGRILDKSNSSSANPRESSTAGGVFSHTPSQLRPLRAHEGRDANVKWLFGIVIFLLASVLVIHAGLAWFLVALKRGPSPTDSWSPNEAALKARAAQSTFPRLQVSPPLDLEAFRAKEQTELNTYGWINRTSGIVRVPIERAMEMVLQEGLPTRATTNQNTAGPSSYQLIQRRLELHQTVGPQQK